MTALKKTTCDALDCWIFFFSLHYKGKRKPPAISSNTSVTDGINKQDREQRVSTKRAEGRWETERHGGPQVNGKVSTQKNKLKGKTGKFGKCSEREERRTYGLKSLAQEGEGKTDEYICAVIIVTINAVKLPFTAGRRRMK